MRKAIETSASSWVAAIAHPTTWREKRSSTMARESQPTSGPHSGNIARPLLIGTAGYKILVEQVRSNPGSRLTPGGSRAMGTTASTQSLLAHESSNSLPRAADPLLVEFHKESGTPIEPSMRIVGCSKLFEPTGRLIARARSSGVCATHNSR